MTRPKQLRLLISGQRAGVVSEGEVSQAPDSLSAAAAAVSASFTSELPRMLTDRVTERAKRCGELLAR